MCNTNSSILHSFTQDLAGASIPASYPGDTSLVEDKGKKDTRGMMEIIKHAPHQKRTRRPFYTAKRAKRPEKRRA